MGNATKASSKYVEWMKDTSQFNEDFIKNYNEERDEGYFLEIDVQYLEEVPEFHNNLPFFSEIIKLEKSKILKLIYMIKLNTLYT